MISSQNMAQHPPTAGYCYRQAAETLGWMGGIAVIERAAEWRLLGDALFAYELETQYM